MMQVPHNPNRSTRGPTAMERRLALLEHKVNTMGNERKYATKEQVIEAFEIGMGLKKDPRKLPLKEREPERDEPEEAGEVENEG